ncbi:hypothetical protein AX774_g515 [Zancudomyces culisetae]|uniref:Protein transport protein sec1 n=1 Tax=Zancudomyces culisetae TaxID=1213189 RepID=A0A1R1PY94_ZANCU|nr:hypothetical protein AX774_g515 [Zancudomyces culisetae]|eukprot:OMH85934.1 hypothetical protein AX774_g515 [Zancudomyces culisetae]
MERCMHEIEKNKLKDVLSIEEAVVTGEAYSSTKRTNEIKAQLEAIGISDMLKTRLYLLGLEIRFLLLKNKENKGVKVEVEDDPLLVSPLTALFANEQILWKSLVYISGMTRLYSIREINVSFAREKLINLALKAASTNNSAEFGMGLHAYSGNDDRVQSSILNWINLVDITHTVNWFNCAEENQEKVYHKSIVRLVLETVSVGLLPYNLFPEYFTIKKVFKNNEILNTAKTNGARNYNRNRDNKINHNNESGGSVTHSGTYNSSAINSNSNINNTKNINSAPNVNGDGDTTGNSFSLLKNTEDFFNNINKRSPGLRKASREPLMLNKKFKIITQKTPTWQVNRSSVINTLNYDTSISDNGGFKDIPKVQDRVSSEKMYDNHTPKTTHRTFIPSTLRNTSVFKKKRFAKDEKFEESSDYKTKVDSSTTSAKNSENCDNNVNEDAPIKQSTTNPFEHSRNKSEKNNDKKYTSHNRRVSIASSPGVSLPPVLNANRPMIIVFVLGGITYSELKEAHNIAVAKNYRILLGSNEILTASKFFNHLSDLSESPANPNEKLSANLIPSYKAMGYGGFKDKSTAAGTSGGSSGGGLYGGAAKKTQNNNSPVSKINSKMGELLSSTSNSVSTAADDPLLSFISLHP